MKRSASRLLVIMALVICIAMALPGMSAAAVNLGTYTVGSNVGTVTVWQSNEAITGVSLAFGSLPPGMSASYGSNALYVMGTPTNTGTYYAEYSVVTPTGTRSVDVSLTINAAAAPTPNYNVITTPDPSYVVSNVPNITKHPTGETVDVGGTAKFVARAENFSSFTWRIVSPDTTCTYKATEASYYFPGLTVSGTDSERLVLSNIPASLNGWCVEAKFTNAAGSSYSNGARVTVKSAAAATPAPSANPGTNTNTDTTANTNTNTGTENKGDVVEDSTVKTANINAQPRGAQVNKGDSYTLSVMATSPNNGTLTYQWYTAAVDDIDAALPISGASGEEYTLDSVEGNAYFWVGIWNTRDGRRSDVVYSDSVHVGIIPTATPTPVPTVEPVVTAEPTGSATLFNSGTTQLVIFGVVGLLALAALIGVVIYLRIDAKRKEE